MEWCALAVTLRQPYGPPESQRIDSCLAEARRLSKSGRLDDAYGRLVAAVDAGLDDDEAITADGSLDPLRACAGFPGLLKQVRIRRYIAMLERPERDDFQKPAEVMRALAFRPGERVADVGAGSGYFTVRVARAVEPLGSVWAVDLHQQMLDHLQRRLAAEGIGNVRLHLGRPDDPCLPDAAFDTIFSVDVWHYLADRPGYAHKLRRALAPGGRIVIVDYVPKPYEVRPWGPLPEQQLPLSAVHGDMRAAGLVPRTVHDFLTEQYLVEYAEEDNQ